MCHGGLYQDSNPKKLPCQSQKYNHTICFDFINSGVKLHEKLTSGVPQHQERICSSEVKKAEDLIIDKLCRHRVHDGTIFPAAILFAGLRLGDRFFLSLSFNFAERAFSSEQFPSALSFCQASVWCLQEAQPLEP